MIENVTTSKEIHRRTGRTFYVATRVLPERVRRATYVLYAFFRVADEVVDQENPPAAAEQRARLERLRREALGEQPTDDEVLDAFQTLRDGADISDEEVDVFIDAMEMDIETARYETYDELEAYMRGSAVAVGNMMMEVMDVEAFEAARPHAAALAEAFQLSNFLRDVAEDIEEYGRVYLPQETLDHFDVSEQELADREMSPRFEAVIRAELARTEQRYREGVAGIHYLPEDCQFAVLLAAVLYADHHRRIRAIDYDVLNEDANLSMTRRLYLAAKTWWYWRRSEDPERVFYAVTSIPEQDQNDPTGVGREPMVDAVPENVA